MRRILITVQYFELGGMEKLVTELALGLQGRGHHLCAAGVYGSGPHARRLEEADIPVYTNLARNRFDFGAVGRLRDICREQQVDFTITAMGAAMHASYVTIRACRALGIPCVRWIHHTPGDHLNVLARLAERRMTRSGNRVIALSEAHARAMVEFWHIPRRQIEVIWNGQPLPPRATMESRRLIRQELGLDEDSFVVGMVAGFRPVKRHPIAIEAFARLREALPEARLLLVGEGPTRSEAESLVDERRLRPCVTFTGARTDATRLYAAMDVHVLCSYPAETFPLAVTEAMAAGVPCVAAAVGGLGELIRDGETGRLVAAESPPALAEAIVDLARNPGNRAAISDAAHEFARAHFTLDAMVDAFEQLMNHGGDCERERGSISA